MDHLTHLETILGIFKKMETGMDKFTAAKEGSKEIYFAVIATSITLAIVFLPIIFLQGFVGRLFREFGIVVAGAVLGMSTLRLGGHYLAMVTIAFGQVFYYIAFQWSSLTGGDDGLRGFSRQPIDLGF